MPGQLSPTLCDPEPGFPPLGPIRSALPRGKEWEARGPFSPRRSWWVGHLPSALEAWLCPSTWPLTSLPPSAAGGPRILHPRPLLSDVSVCSRVGDPGPQYPPPLLPPLEVRAAAASGRVRWGSWAGWGWEPRGWTLRPLLPPRYFHRPADGSEVMYDAVSIMNADILNYCQKESWCKLAFYLLSFFYYLYR